MNNSFTFNTNYCSLFIGLIECSGVRIVVYDSFRKNLGADGDDGLPLWQAAMCGVTAGGLAQW